MREIQILNWCDICFSSVDAKVASIGTITMGMATGETKPSLHVLDLCAEHLELLTSTYSIWQANSHPLVIDKNGKVVPGLPSPARARVPHESDAPRALRPGNWQTRLVDPDAPRKLGTDRMTCPVCREDYNRSSLVGHVWKTHREMDRRPPQPRRCPECREEFRPNGMAIHRIRSHGYDPLAEALQGLPLSVVDADPPELEFRTASSE